MTRHWTFHRSAAVWAALLVLPLQLTAWAGDERLDDRIKPDRVDVGRTSDKITPEQPAEKPGSVQLLLQYVLRKSASVIHDAQRQSSEQSARRKKIVAAGE